MRVVREVGNIMESLPRCRVPAGGYMTRGGMMILIQDSTLKEHKRFSKKLFRKGYLAWNRNSSLSGKRMEE